MRLAELTAIEPLRARCAPPNASSPEVSSLAYDSRRVLPGALFFCVTGLQSDGHRFAGEAIERGAAALVVERPLGLGVPEIQVESVRASMGPIAASFHGDPTAELRVIGVTGTNGKTTTAYLVRAMMEALGGRCGLLGTVKSVIAGEELPVVRTTPEAIDLQADFRAMLDGGDRACAMEVSSHALALGRTDAVRFTAAIFTNLTQDHLDFHPTMEDYFQAKRLLFGLAPGGLAEGGGGAASVVRPSDVPSAAATGTGSAARPPGVSVINIGDPYGRRLAREIVGKVVTFAVEDDADYSARALRSDFDGTRFELRTPAGGHTVALPMPGRFNVANALGALAAAHALGGNLMQLVAALERGVRVPGRFESIDEGQDFAVIVDYAHTPDSLENVLLAARELTTPRRGRLLCVFGAGGDRDRGKRPLMGGVAARLADVLLVTSDNPRSEDPQVIAREIMAGVAQADPPPGASPPVMELDRRAAIGQAVEQARAGDVLVIAGKGHEQGQEFADGLKLPFDDASVAREALGVRVSR
jgi:UDP-N-acetylmuramoyl-L-alanyl-D-glutamate--2,6-diaminopimelate ligase